MIPPGSQSLYLLEVGLRWPPETFLRWKLEALAARGLRVAVASRSIAEPAARVSGVELIPLPQPGAPRGSAMRTTWALLGLMVARPRAAARLLRGIRALPAALRRRYGGARGLLPLYLPLAGQRPDVVHFEWLHAAVLYLPMFGVWGCPVIASCHGSEVSVDPHVPGQEVFTAVLPELMRSASAVHCVSDALRPLVLELGAPAGAIRVIHQGVDPAVFLPGEEAPLHRDRPFKVIVVGWPRWVKGFEWALAAARRLIDAGVPAQLEILGAYEGDPTEVARVRQTVADLGLEGHVWLREALDTPEVARAMRSSDVLLLPSLAEGLPTVVLEAMACGLPVVATDCGGVREAVSDGREGFLAAPRDSIGMARALQRLWLDPALRRRMGQAGRRAVTSRFTLARQIDEFQTLYQEVARA